MIRNHAFEYRTVFLYEERTEAYRKYAVGAPQEKMLLCAKSSRRAVSSAERVAGGMRGFL